jgi:hypothetical protein
MRMEYNLRGILSEVFQCILIMQQRNETFQMLICLNNSSLSLDITKVKFKKLQYKSYTLRLSLTVYEL